MKLNLNFFQGTAKNTVTTVTTVTPANDAVCTGNQRINSPVTSVTKNEKVTVVTEAKKVRLLTEPANDAEVSEVTEVTAKNAMTDNFLRSFLEIERAELFRVTQPDQPTDLGVCISLLGKLHDKTMTQGDTDTALELEHIYNELEKAKGADGAVAKAEPLLESLAARLHDSEVEELRNERAAIMEYDGGLDRERAEGEAARVNLCFCCGGAHYWVSSVGAIVCECCHPPAPGASVAQRFTVQRRGLKEDGGTFAGERLYREG